MIVVVHHAQINVCARHPLKPLNGLHGNGVQQLPLEQGITRDGGVHVQKAVRSQLASAHPFRTEGF